MDFSEDMNSNRSLMTRRNHTMSGIGLKSYSCTEDLRQTSGQLIDIRSPSEFNQGHWPGAINLPLFSDEERAAVGNSYKREGREKAILLGLKFTAPKLLTLQKKLEQGLFVYWVLFHRKRRLW